MTKGKFLFLVFAIFLFILVLPLTYSALDKYGHLKVTSEHPFLVDKEWISASELQEGDILETSRGERVKITNIEDVQEKEIFEVYNMHVSGPETFFADDILVHNKAMPAEYKFEVDDARKIETVEEAAEINRMKKQSRVKVCDNCESPYYYGISASDKQLIDELGPTLKETRVSNPEKYLADREDVMKAVEKIARRAARQEYYRNRGRYPTQTEEDIKDFIMAFIFFDDTLERFNPELTESFYQFITNRIYKNIIRDARRELSPMSFRGKNKKKFWENRESLDFYIGDEGLTVGDWVPSPMSVMEDPDNINAIRKIYEKSLEVSGKGKLFEMRVRDAQVFRAKYRYGLSVKEIAREIGVSESRVSQIVKELKSQFDSDVGLKELFESLGIEISPSQFFDKLYENGAILDVMLGD
jgi:RNA polymerase sigma factor (sigma-70 family)